MHPRKQAFSKKQQILLAVFMFMAGLILAFYLTPNPMAPQPSPPLSTGEQVAAQGAGLMATKPPALPSPAAFEGPEGLDMTLDGFKGHWVIVNFWATWCQPCIAEMPSFARMLAELGPQAPVFVPISIDAMGRGAAEPFAQSKGWTHVRAYADPKSDLYRTFQAPGIPLTLILNPEGKEVARRLGPTNWDSPEVVEQMKRLMAGQPL